MRVKTIELYIGMAEIRKNWVALLGFERSELRETKAASRPAEVVFWRLGSIACSLERPSVC